MRIISGKWGGRKIHPPANMPHTRPTTDIAKEGLFNILQSRMNFDGIQVLDLFGGTGCISYELASRGAAHLTIVEKDPIMHGFIKKNLDTLGMPAYQLFKLIVANQLIAPGGFFVLEHTPRNAYEKYAGFSFVRNYGTTVFSFFTKQD
ncbi:MAG: hypothetical protein FD183_1662 [Chitinophagaceae bacterium]|nr:MAG: hypothetical protein FD183_1662 [Chitinophagaceae bacterium]